MPRLSKLQWYGPVLREEWEIARDEQLIPMLEADGEEYRIVGPVPHRHGPMCPDYGKAAEGDFECSPEHDVDIEYRVMKEFDL